ncbi:MAG TPA: hypothetical protein VFG55_07335, partial [Rhodanobacteraceae bacterium]|nr:hypothetical protein [Rhodanobacteraceae bacterium]
MIRRRHRDLPAAQAGLTSPALAKTALGQGEEPMCESFASVPTTARSATRGFDKFGDPSQASRSSGRAGWADKPSIGENGAG